MNSCPVAPIVMLSSCKQAVRNILQQAQLYSGSVTNEMAENHIAVVLLAEGGGAVERKAGDNSSGDSDSRQSHANQCGRGEILFHRVLQLNSPIRCCIP